jgi:hypothetical protein
MRWDGHQLWAWDETKWVEQGSPALTTDIDAQASSDALPDSSLGEPVVPAPERSRPAPASWATREPASATDIEKRFGSTFDEFEKAPIPELAPPPSGSGQAPSSKEPPPEESVDS